MNSSAGSLGLEGRAFLTKSPPLGVPDRADGELEACWNEIGVYGNGECAELAAHIHCRNCPVYASAGARLLDRPLPADYRRECSQHFALQKKAVTPGRISAVLFRLNSEWLA